jgi:hypothetical protein
MIRTMIRPTVEDRYRQAYDLDSSRPSNASSAPTFVGYLCVVLAAIVCGVLVAAVNEGWM